MARNDKIRKRDKKDLKEILFFALVVGLLGVIIAGTSYKLLTNSLVGSVASYSTSRYISFNYSLGEEEIFTVKAKKVSDDVGMNLSNYTDFAVTGDSSRIKDENLSYQIIVSLLNENIDTNDVRIYLSDGEDDRYNKNKVLKLSECHSELEGKVVYTTTFTKKNMEHKYRLRIWIDKDNKQKIDKDLVYKVIVRTR